jgi:hypothetical protein
MSVNKIGNFMKFDRKTIELTTINTCYLKASAKHYRIPSMSIEPPNNIELYNQF